MNLLKFKLLALLAILLFGVSCSNDDTDEPTGTAPVVTSSSPTNGATDIAITSGNLTITVVFDQNITFNSSDYTKITLDNAVIKSANASNATLTIQAGSIAEGTSYTLIIPEGIVKGTGDLYNKEISISFTTKTGTALVSPVDSEATENTKKLYTFLQSIYGTKTLSSTMATVSWNTIEAENVYKLTGKYPAINCFDFIHIQYSPANWIDYSDITPVADWANNGGIVSLMWHFNVPVKEGSDQYTYSSKETTFSASNVFTDNTWENTYFYEQIDKVSAVLLQLQDAGIPAIWRPFHEGAGNYYAGGDAWFWWGYEGPEIYVKLWKLMFEYFNQKGIHNLIWVWTTENNGDGAYYPGDDYVDIVGRDLYGKNATESYSQWNTVNTDYQQKMVALSECGNKVNGRTIISSQAIIPEQWSKGCQWLYFMPWYDYDYDTGNANTNVICSDYFWTSAMTRNYVLKRNDVAYLNLHN